MRHPLVPPLLVVLALLAYAILGTVAVGAGAPAQTVTVTGTVTDDDGRAVEDAYVLLEPVDGDLLAEYTDGDRVVVESLLKLAEGDPDGITVVRTGADGRFSASVPEGRYRTVAVTRERISQLRDVDARGDGTGDVTVDMVVDRNGVLRLDAEGAGPVAPGNTTSVTVRVANPDDEGVRSLVVTVGDLPAGWALVGVDTGGRYDADASLIQWAEVPAGGTATATLRVRVPEGAERGHHRLPLSARSESHYVEQFDDGTVVVRPANATPTPTSIGGEGTSNVTGTATLTRTPTSSPGPTERNTTNSPPTGTTTPGFGPAVALAVLLAALVATESR